jgi:4-amino-4-deoxy-L-arabinose transferase-like glycosyltransferase
MTHVGRPFTWREGVGITLLAFALTVYFTWPLALRPHELGRLALGDGQFSVWNVAWVAHALSTGADVFDANIFHPHKTTLAYSEANLGAGTLALPAYLLTGNPYAAHNSAVLVGLTFSVIGMYLLARRLTGNLPASLVAAILFAFCPFLFARTAHIQLMMTAPFPFVLLAFHVFADDASVKRAVMLGLSIAVQALFCAYYGVLVGLIVGLGVLMFSVQRRTWRQPRWWYLTALAAAVSVIIVLPFFLPYIRLQDETGFGRTLDDAGGFSADWRAYFASSAFAHSWMLPLLGQWKEVLFPGFSALILGTFGAVMSLRRRPRQDGSSSSPIGRDVALFYLIVFVLALWSSFGPSAGLYTLLHHTVPVFSLLRAPARFGLAVTLVLSVFSAAGLTLLLARSRPTVRTWLAAAVMIFAVAELSTRIPYDTAGPVPRAYKVLAAAQRGAVVELPFYYLAHERYQQTRYMIGSTSHWQPLVNGYSDFIPPDFFEGAKLLENFPDEAGLKWLRARDTRYVLFHLNLYDEASRARLDERIAAHASQLQPRYLFGLVHIYELVDVPSSP